MFELFDVSMFEHAAWIIAIGDFGYAKEVVAFLAVSKFFKSCGFPIMPVVGIKNTLKINCVSYIF